jgi:release factor glutamine methyltransferase
MTSRWTVLELLKTVTQYLDEKAVESSRLDAELLLAHVLKMDRVGLYCAFDRPLQNDEVDVFRGFIKRRAKGEPVAYLLGEKEFYSLVFSVDPRVLIPRPETEHLVDRALEILAPGEKLRVLDIGTGSGAIAVAVAINRVDAQITATDISGKSLEIATKNAKDHKVDSRIRFVEGDLFTGCDGGFSVVLSNPPYIDRDDSGSLSSGVVDYEPAGALFAGEGGMCIIRRIIEEAPEFCLGGAFVLIEIGHDQAERAMEIVEKSAHYQSASFIRDYSGKRRVLELRIIGS